MKRMQGTLVVQYCGKMLESLKMRFLQKLSLMLRFCHCSFRVLLSLVKCQKNQTVTLKQLIMIMIMSVEAEADASGVNPYIFLAA